MRSGSKLGVWYAGGTVRPERLLLYQVDIASGTWVVRTPDGDQYVEQLDCNGPQGCSWVAAVNPKGNPPSIMSGKFFRFVSKPDDAYLRIMIKAAIGQAEQVNGTEQVPGTVITSLGRVCLFLLGCHQPRCHSR